MDVMSGEAIKSKVFDYKGCRVQVEKRAPCCGQKADAKDVWYWHIVAGGRAESELGATAAAEKWVDGE